MSQIVKRQRTPPPSSKKINKAIRKPWLIENSLHWYLDVAFEEDNSRIRKGFADQNFALLRQIALNLLKNDTTSKLGIKSKRIIAGWDDGFLSPTSNKKRCSDCRDIIFPDIYVTSE
ncbi:ISAs1 family transposase [Emticicia sp. 17c]|uniref:ISAs1 family transposase n=1 Tax=Emticicia sp. 17c TaxID=3127704 RepID=UPI00301CDB74